MMKSTGEIMQEMGFNKNSSTSAQEAFLRHLIKASTGAEVQIQPTVKKPHIKSRIRMASAQSEQLSFDFDGRLLKTAI